MHALTIGEQVREVMCSEPLRWYSIPELKQGLVRAYGPLSSLDTGLTARVRDLRKPPYRLNVTARLRKGSTWEYKVLANHQELADVMRFAKWRQRNKANPKFKKLLASHPPPKEWRFTPEEWVYNEVSQLNLFRGIP